MTTTAAANSVHVSVMPSETLEALEAAVGGAFLDCTGGGGGHSIKILDANVKNTVVVCDRDPQAISRLQTLATRYPNRMEIVHARFSELTSRLSGKEFDGMLADLGFSTDQLRGDRGFSFADSNLDMRMSAEGDTAADLINNLEVKDLIRIFKIGGMGNEARIAAHAIVRARPFTSATKFSEVVDEAFRGRLRDKSSRPSTIVFQALRIAVNNEFEEIERLLDAAPKLLRAGGRLVVISFHSLEDKLVAKRLRSWEQGDTAPAWYPGARTKSSLGRVTTKKAVLPTDDEVQSNNPSRSARLRAFKFNG